MQVKLYFLAEGSGNTTTPDSGAGTLRVVVKDNADAYTGEGSVTFLDYPNSVSTPFVALCVLSLTAHVIVSTILSLGWAKVVVEALDRSST